MHGDEIVNEFGGYPVSCRSGFFPQVRLLSIMGDMEISKGCRGFAGSAHSNLCWSSLLEMLTMDTSGVGVVYFGLHAYSDGGFDMHHNG